LHFFEDFPLQHCRVFFKRNLQISWYKILPNLKNVHSKFLKKSKFLKIFQFFHFVIYKHPHYKCFETILIKHMIFFSLMKKIISRKSFLDKNKNVQNQNVHDFPTNTFLCRDLKNLKPPSIKPLYEFVFQRFLHGSENTRLCIFVFFICHVFV
jgi:hypothetical protein